MIRDTCDMESNMALALETHGLSTLLLESACESEEANIQALYADQVSDETLPGPTVKYYKQIFGGSSLVGETLHANVRQIILAGNRGNLESLQIRPRAGKYSLPRANAMSCARATWRPYACPAAARQRLVGWCELAPISSGRAGFAATAITA